VPAASPEESADVTELVRWADELVVHGSDAGRLDRAHGAIDEQAETDLRGAASGGWGQLIVLAGTALTIGVVALLLDGALAGDALRPVLTGVVLLAPLALADVLEAVAEAERRRPDIEAAEARIADLLAAPSPLAEPATDLATPADSTLELDGVMVGWDRDLVPDVSAVLRPGSLWGISAPSGAGKSTLAWTMARFVAPRAGRVRLGGVDTADLRGDTVRRTVGVMAQDETVFDTTVRENLRIARPDATDAELLAAMDRAGLHLDLDREVGEQGARLSGGERQRLTLARLLLGEHRVLVLDEPTEHLDAPLATALVDDLVSLAPAHTVVLVSHDPAVLARCDHVLDLT
jgi:ABC-type transport system involved in cytochrome bd biosynthesis fused ATPase/permease subunit